jgi:hypothetical protein
LARTVVAVGRSAVHQSASILAADFAGTIPGVTLWPGAQWRFDHLLLSVDRKSVRFLAGNILYQEDLDGFLTHEFSSGERVSASQSHWLTGLTRFEVPFCLSLASTLALQCDENISGCSFLDRFGTFYYNHRTYIESAARELHFVLDGIFALRQWPALFKVCIDSMGEQAQSSLPHGVMPPDIGAFLGRLLTGTGSERITLAKLPAKVRDLRESSTEEAGSPREPHLRRMLETLERFAERAVPVLDRLRTAW